MTMELKAVLRLQDKLSEPLRRAITSLNKASAATEQAAKSFDATDKAAKSAATAVGGMDSASKRFATGAARIRNENNKTKSSFESLNKSVSSALDNASNNLTKFGACMLSKGVNAVKYGVVGAVATGSIFAGSALRKAIDFEAELSTIQALTGANSDEMARMQSLALKMGASTKYSALGAAQGIEELLKAGLTPATVQAGGLEAALNLATAGGLELAEAAEIMSTALNAFQKDGLSAAKAANILAGTANASATSVEELRYSLAQVSAVASGIGLSFEDTNVALGLFANSGIKGSDAGTSLKTMLSNLQPTTKAQIDLFKKLGLVTSSGANAFYDSAGNIKSLEEISGTLHKSLSNLTSQQRMLALETMFGSDAIRAANILYKEGAKGVKKFRSEMSKVTALDVARKKMDNASGAIEQFKGALETLQIAALTPTLPMLKNLANAAADAVEKYTPTIAAAVDQMATRTKTYIRTHFTDNPQFKKLTTLESKIGFIFDDLNQTFDAWYAASGQKHVADISAKLASAFASGIEASSGPISDAAMKIGTSIGSGIWQGLQDVIAKHPVLTMLFSTLGGAVAGSKLGPWGALGGGAAGFLGGGAAAINAKSAQSKEKRQQEASIFAKLKSNSAELAKASGMSEMQLWAKALSDPQYVLDLMNATGLNQIKMPDVYIPKYQPNGHAGGLSRVPYDGYNARLHKDEMVLTKGKADEYRNGRGGGLILQISKLADVVNVRKDSDIDELADELARKLFIQVGGGSFLEHENQHAECWRVTILPHSGRGAHEA